MSRKKSLKIAQIVSIVALIIVLIALFYFEKKDSEEQEAYWRQVSEEERAAREKEEERLSIKLLSGRTWEDNDFGYNVDIVYDTNTLIDLAQMSSALYNNARIMWHPDAEFESGSVYAWRFAARTEEVQKDLTVSDGVDVFTYTIQPQETIFYIPATNNLRLDLEMEGHGDEFVPTYISDIQLVKLEGGDFPLAGQYLTKDEANHVIENIDFSYTSQLSADNYQHMYELPDAAAPDYVRIDGNKIGFEVSWPIEEVNTDQETVIVQLTASSKSSSGNFQLIINEEYSATRYLTTQTQEYIFPLRNLGAVTKVSMYAELDYNDMLEMKDGGIYITNISDENAIAGGTYMVDEFESIQLSSENDVLPSMMDAISDGSYMYSVGSNALMVYDISADPSNPIQIAQVDGLGNVRALTFVGNEENALAISARENGVWFVDISNPASPSILSHYDTFELATGIYGYGDYVAICSRYWGVELVDVTDISNPRFCSSVSNRKEYYDCCIEGHYLYVSAWAQKCVEVYDISDVCEPEFITTIALDGNGGGITVQNGILYVATGYNGQGDTTDTFAPAYGTGNGMEIYDVSNPENNEWLSTSKIDGRYWISGYDHWKVCVSGEIAYFSSVSNGVYIFDISNPSAPIRMEHISIEIPSGSPNYTALSNVYILPEGGNGAGREIITSVLPVEGFLYIMGNRDGTYVYADSEAKLEQMDIEDLEGGERESERIWTENYEVIQFESDTAVYATASAEDGKIYVASGRSGIYVLDEKFNKQYEYKTEGEVKDLILNGDYLYSAEGEAGFAVYSITASGLIEIGRCTADFQNVTFSTISLSGDGKHIIAQAGFSRICIIDVSNPSVPVIVDIDSIGSMYSRNLCAGNVVTSSQGELTAVFGRGTINWYDSRGSLYNSTANSLTGESDGAAALGNLVLALKDQGYVYYDPTKVEEDALDTLSVIKIEDVILRGKPVIKDDLMVVSYGYGHTIFLVDISDLDNPSLIESIEVIGNPDVAEITEDYILIPLRNEGLLMLKEKTD